MMWTALIKASIRLVWLLVAVMIVCLLVWVSRPAKAADIAIGDSIALGTGHAMGIATVAVKGVGSCAILGWMPRSGSYRHVVISAGINDGGQCVAAIRLKLRAVRITWIVPANINPGAGKVLAVIKQYGDGHVAYACKPACSRVNFHPASYSAVAAAVRNDWSQH